MPTGRGAERAEKLYARVLNEYGDDSVAQLGAAHVARYGASVEVLIKLLDLNQRLPVHLHPNREFSRTHLGLAHGKTEAWYVLDAPEGAQVGVGFKKPMSLAEVSGWVAQRDSDALLGALRTRTVRPGDAMLVPAGLPHTVQSGVFVLELQEPTDLSILLEWQGFAVDGAKDGHLDLGFETALQAVDLSAVADADLDALVLPREAIEMDVRLVERLGVRFHFNTSIGTDIAFDQLQKDFDAVAKLQEERAGVQLRLLE